MRTRWIVLIVVIVVIMAVSIIPIWSALSNTVFNTGGAATYESYNPYGSGGTWYKGQTHDHSTRSDGELAPSEVVARYADLGFKFIAITDHHTITKIKGGSLLVLGQEYGKGSTESGEMYKPHMSGINISSVYSESASLQSRIDSINSQRGLVVLNHPTTLLYAYDMDELVGLDNYTGLEIFNGYSDGFLSGDPVSTWDKVLSTGKRVWGVASDDAHGAEDYGKGWVEVRLSGKLTTGNVVNAIKHGSFYSTQGPTISDLRFDGTTFSVSSPGADSISFYGRNGKLLSSVDGGYANYTVDWSGGYVRAEVYKDGLKAWSQPVFIGSKTTSSTFQVMNDGFVMSASWCTARGADLDLLRFHA
jgi:hypothetical protein